MALYNCPIPKITDPLGLAWEQPAHSEIKFTSDGYAVITEKGLAKLKEYDVTLPSGVYTGKMWRRKEDGVLYLCWYQDSPGMPGKCDLKFRRILPQQAFDLLNPGGAGNL